MLFLELVCAFVVANVPCFFANPIALSHPQKRELSPLFVEDILACSDQEARQWSYDFHECFIDRKAGDGGRDLENIVDRILDHSKDCIRNSSKMCRPYYNGFIIIMEKVIQQMKDYAEMYLEFIHNGRNKIKDLRCVENVINIQTYSDCFKETFKYNSSKSEFQGEVENSIKCTNQKNNGCSNLAKTDLNTIVRRLMRVDLSAKEDFASTDPPKRVDLTTRKEDSSTSESTKRLGSSTIWRGFSSSESTRRVDSSTSWEDDTSSEFFNPRGSTRNGHSPNPPPKQQPKEQPWAWYDYIAAPFRYVWGAIRSLFGF